MIESLDFIRSNLLAELMERHSPQDIAIEDFIHYEDLMEMTLNSPDEICHLNGPNGEDLVVHILAQERDGVSFFYYVICDGAPFLKKILPKEQIDENQVIPLLAFPSIDGEIYKYYRRGRQIMGGPRN